jgi:hypothetical protein
MRAVRKFYEWHFLRVSHHDVEIENLHFFPTGQSGPRLDQAHVQCLHPVRKTVRVIGQVSRGFFDTLQALAVGIFFVKEVDRVDGLARCR